MASYAAEQKKQTADRTYILQKAGSLALSQHPSSRMLELGEDLDYEPYKNYLREKNGSRYDFISHRTKLLDTFNSFRPVLEQVEGRLGLGGSSVVSVITLDNNPYALRQTIAQDRESDIDNHILASTRVRQMPQKYQEHVEHLVAATYENGGMTIAEVMPGKEINKLQPEDIEQITQEQIDELVETMIEAEKVGVQVDITNAGNVFYDPEKGFGLVDLDTSAANKRYRVTLSLALSHFPELISNIGDSKKDMETFDDYVDKADRLAIIMPVLRKYQHACDALPGYILDSRSRNNIASTIAKAQEIIDNFSHY